MEAPDQITGERKIEIFRQLQEDRTVLTLRLLGRDYERLTVVTGLELNGDLPSFFVDYPRGFRKVVSGDTGWALRFEFTGKDRLAYRFRTQGGRLRKDALRLPMPQAIERIQRRAHFRVEAPLNSLVRFPDPRSESEKLEMVLVNISVGGALMASRKSGDPPEFLRVGSDIRGIQVVLSVHDEEVAIPVRSAVVRRVERDKETDRCRYALKFETLPPTEAEHLMELIWEVQRLQLRKQQLL